MGSRTTPSAVVSLAMYPFASLRAATDTLWSVARRHLGWGPSALEWDQLPPAVWYHDDLVLGQACGWPLVTSLADRVAAIGTFDFDVPGGEGGTYQSVIIGRDSTPLDRIVGGPGVVVAVNAFDSLSGWVSLQHVWGGVPDQVVHTGSHLDSVRAVVDGHAEVASIDAVSWFHICREEPRLASALHIIGSGPRVPCLPLVTSRVDSVAELRDALAAAVADPTARSARDTLRIRTFVPLDNADYRPVRSLVP